jgi:fumarate reductase subunit C
MTVSEWLPSAAAHSETSSISPPSSSLSHAGVRRAMSLIPVIAMFLIAALLFAINKESFTEPLSFQGVITIPILSGVFAMLMLVAARRKGDCLIGFVLKPLGNPIVVALVVTLFLSAIFLHGLIIWSEPIPRAAAIIVGCLLLAFILRSLRAGEFTPRAVAQVRYEARGARAPLVELVAVGAPANGNVEYGGQTRSAGTSRAFAGDESVLDITFDPATARELKVWVHQLNRAGVSHPIPAFVSLARGEPIDLGPLAGTIVLPITGDQQPLHIVAEPTR